MEETAASSGAAPSPDAPTEHQSLEDIIERWWADHFPGSPSCAIMSKSAGGRHFAKHGRPGNHAARVRKRN